MILYCFIVLIFVILLFIGFFIWIRRKPKSWDKPKNNKMKGGGNDDIIEKLHEISTLTGTTDKNDRDVIEDDYAFIDNPANIESGIIDAICGWLFDVIQDSRIEIAIKRNAFIISMSYIKHLYRVYPDVLEEVVLSDFFVAIFPVYIEVVGEEDSETNIDTIDAFLTIIHVVANSLDDGTEYLNEFMRELINNAPENTFSLYAYIVTLMLCLYNSELHDDDIQEYIRSNSPGFVTHIDELRTINKDVIDMLSLYIDYVMRFFEEPNEYFELIDGLIGRVIEYYYAQKGDSSKDYMLLENARDLVIRYLTKKQEEIPEGFYTVMNIEEIVGEVCENGENELIESVLAATMDEIEVTPDDEVNRLEIVVDRLSSILDVMREDYVVLV